MVKQKYGDNMRFKQYLIEKEDKITLQDLRNLEMYADMLFKNFNIDVEFTKHFFERVNDKRNKKQITFSELANMFRKAYRKHGQRISKFPDGAEAVLKDMASDLNIPFAIVWDSLQNEFDLVTKSIMRKKNFKTRSQELRVG
jgi:hypothetical protein